MLFTAFYYSSQVLRVETLSRCDSVRTLLMAAMVSFVAYYLISAALLIVPSWLYLTCVVLAPLAFLCGVRPKQGMTAGVGTAAGAAHESSAQVYSGPSDMSPAPSWRAWLTPAALLMLLFGITGGLITASGDAVPASTLDELLSMPSPVYLAMVLVYLVLGILVVRGRRLQAVAFYVMMSVAWMLGTFAGGAILAMLPGLPPVAFVIFASTIALLIAASFVAFRNLWISVPDSLGSDRVSRIEELSNQAGLTKRESEVFRLLAEGRSLPYVQEKLFISEGTARTHIKHIYTKLDVHSKQEMLDKIEF